MQISLPGGPLSQLSNASFAAAALFGDVLLIRLFLSMAYIFLCASALVGLPRWPSVSSTDTMVLDTIIWSAISGFFHIFALVRLVADERRITFADEDEEAMWRFFYRRSGMGRLEMKQVLRFGRWRRIKAGAVILDPLASCSRLCLMVQGVGEFMATAGLEQGVIAHSTKLSGGFFDMRLLNVFGLYVGFEGVVKGVERMFTAVAQTDCLVYEWTVEELNAMASRCSPSLSHAWRNLVATQVGLTLASLQAPNLPPTAGTGDPESAAIMFGARSRDFTDPLRQYECPQPWSLLGIFRWLGGQFHPIMPPGMRHNDLPVHGILARNRIVALKESQLRSAAQQEGEEGRWSEEDEQRATLATLATLRRVESLTALQMTDVVKLAKEISMKRLSWFEDHSIRSDPGPTLPPVSP